MTGYDKAPTTYSPAGAYWSRLRAAVRGLIGVTLFVLEAVEELITALLHLPRITPYIARLWRILADEYRVRAAGAIDADIEEGGTPDGA